MLQGPDYVQRNVPVADGDLSSGCAGNQLQFLNVRISDMNRPAIVEFDLFSLSSQSSGDGDPDIIRRQVDQVSCLQVSELFSGHRVYGKTDVTD